MDDTRDAKVREGAGDKAVGLGASGDGTSCPGAPSVATPGDTLHCDVLVIGSGLAGCEAALAAAREGASVILASAGAPFSGSSAFPGTWGLGLVGPAGNQDENDLVRAICEVGRGVALPDLARTLVRGVAPAVTRLEARGVELRVPERAGERDYVPCFDRVHRDWHGIPRSSYRAATLAALGRAGVRELPCCELADLPCADDGRATGAVLYDSGRGHWVRIFAGAVVLATGGFGGLFSRTLTTPDVLGTAAAAALRTGARLVNVEFIQIMPGLVEPVKGVVFNEKTFRYARVEGPGAEGLLDARSGHGPFSASLPDRTVDLAVAERGLRGAAVSFDLPDKLPEFMRTYFDWFAETYDVRAEKGVRIAPYAHASNGGILVDERARTGVPGLLACGEATGGMHGADRIGGLASANALVFGEIAGREAAYEALSRTGAAGAGYRPGGPGVKEETLAALGSSASVDVLAALRRELGERALLTRSEQGLLVLEGCIDELEGRLRAGMGPATPRDVMLRRRAELALLSARALTAAMRARRESRGSHYRSDFPDENPAQAQPLVVSLTQDGITVAKHSTEESL